MATLQQKAFCILQDTGDGKGQGVLDTAKNKNKKDM
jgi:hypothetical protein